MIFFLINHDNFSRVRIVTSVLHLILNEVSFTLPSFVASLGGSNSDQPAEMRNGDGNYEHISFVDMRVKLAKSSSRSSRILKFGKNSRASRYSLIHVN